MTSVEERLRLLEDKEAIRDLLLAYGSALDGRDTKAYSELFAADGEWSGGVGQSKTPAGIKKMLDDLFSTPNPSRKSTGAYHLMSNMDIVVDGDTATAKSRWAWIAGNADGSPTILRSGIYEDALIREDGCWKFRKRRALTEFSTPFD